MNIATGKEVNEMYSTYLDADTSFFNYTIKFPDGVNDVDPLVMLKTMQARDNMDAKLNFGVLLTNGRKVEIWMDGVEQHTDEETGKVVPATPATLELSYTFNGQGNIAVMYSRKPYLLQAFIDFTYGLLLKKLTPPSRN